MNLTWFSWTKIYLHVYPLGKNPWLQTWELVEKNKLQKRFCFFYWLEKGKPTIQLCWSPPKDVVAMRYWPLWFLVILSALWVASLTFTWYSTRNCLSCSKKESTSWNYIQKYGKLKVVSFLGGGGTLILTIFYLSTLEIFITQENQQNHQIISQLK